MKRTLIIGCGGVASVAIHKCVQNSEVFEEIMIASRTKSKCACQIPSVLQGSANHFFVFKPYQLFTQITFSIVLVPPILYINKYKYP